MEDYRYDSVDFDVDGRMDDVVRKVSLALSLQHGNGELAKLKSTSR